MAYYIDARRNVDHIEYLIRQVDNWPCATMPSSVAFERCPTLVLDFLERHVHYVIDNTGNSGVRFQASETNNPIGNPIRITCEKFLNITTKNNSLICILCNLRYYQRRT